MFPVKAEVLVQEGMFPTRGKFHPDYTNKKVHKTGPNMPMDDQAPLYSLIKISEFVTVEKLKDMWFGTWLYCRPEERVERCTTQYT